MRTTSNQRIEAPRVNMKIKSVTELAKIIGVQQTSLNANISKNVEPRFTLLSKILAAFPDISAEWLMKGEGEMMKTASTTEAALTTEAPHATEQLLREMLAEKDKIIIEQSKEIGRLQEQLRAQEKDVPGAISTDGARVG